MMEMNEFIKTMFVLFYLPSPLDHEPLVSEDQEELKGEMFKKNEDHRDSPWTVCSFDYFLEAIHDASYARGKQNQ